MSDPLERLHSALRLDLYHELFRMPLPLMISVLFVVYIVINLAFAGLYMIGGDAGECTGTDGTFGEVFFNSTFRPHRYCKVPPTTITRLDFSVRDCNARVVDFAGSKISFVLTFHNETE